MKPNPFDPGYFKSEELTQFGFKSVGDNVSIAKNCTIIGLENISIGNNVRIDGGATLACHSGGLNIGNYIHIGANSFLACGAGVILRDFSGLSQGVKIYSVSDDYSGDSLTNPSVPKEYLKTISAPVVLEKHVIIGAGSVILPGANIGEGSAVGALSLVTQPLDEWGVYAGIPAKRMKDRSKDLLNQEAALI